MFLRAWLAVSNLHIYHVLDDRMSETYPSIFVTVDYYTGLGACGWWSNDSDMVVALPDHVYDNFPGATPWWDTSESLNVETKVEDKGAEHMN